jgi:hypothetical protein
MLNTSEENTCYRYLQFTVWRDQEWAIKSWDPDPVLYECCIHFFNVKYFLKNVLKRSWKFTSTISIEMYLH